MCDCACLFVCVCVCVCVCVYTQVCVIEADTVDVVKELKASGLDAVSARTHTHTHTHTHAACNKRTCILCNPLELSPSCLVDPNVCVINRVVCNGPYACTCADVRVRVPFLS